MMFEITPKLDVHGKIPLYIQLYEYLKQEMKAGNLSQHTKLPSKRKLAHYLQISQNTVEAAYSQLIAEGYIESIPRKGYYVCKVDQNHFELLHSSKDIKEKENQDHTYMFDFSHTGVDIHSFPFRLFRKITNDVLQLNHHQVLMLGHPQGEYVLREQITNYLYESRGVRCSPSQMVIGSGTQTLLKMLFQILTGSVFAVEDPGFHRKFVTFEKGIEAVKLTPLDDDGIIISELVQSNANIVFVTPSHQFPAGMVMPISRRLQLLQWADQQDNRFIIEDDYDSEFRYSGKPIPALQGLDTNEKVIYMGTFSKALLPSIRVSYMVLPRPLIEIYQKDFFFYSQTVSRIDQEILFQFLQLGHWEKHIQRMRVVYRKKRDVLVSAISLYFPQNVEIIGQDSGLHILLHPNNGMDEQELVERANEVGIKVYPVSRYGKGDNKTILIGFAILSEKDIVKAIQMLARAWF